MIARVLRTLRMKRELDHKLKVRRIARLAKAEAARRGVSTYWQRAAAKHREMFGQ
jgi:hypothetical protein